MKRGLRGLGPDRWMGTRLVYRVWPRAGSEGRYVVVLALPTGYATRHVEVGVADGRTRSLSLKAGKRVRFVLRTAGRPPGPMRIVVRMPLGPLNARPLGVRVLALRYIIGGRSN